MSKTFKRIFSAALVLCMLLAVLPATAPAANAYEMDDSAVEIVYDFGQPKLNGSKVAKPSGVTADNYKQMTGSKGQPLNWYFLRNSAGSSYDVWSNGYLYHKMSNTNHWIAVVLDVPAGEYEYDFKLKALSEQKSINGVYFVKVEDGLVDSFKTVAWNSVGNLYSGKTVLTALFNTTISRWNGNYSNPLNKQESITAATNYNVGMLGRATLNGGENGAQYIMIIRGGTQIASNCYLTPVSLTLTRSDNKADSLNKALSEAYVVGNQIVHIAATEYDLGNDYIQFEKSGHQYDELVVLDLNGKTLRAGGVVTAADGHIVDSSSSSTGKLISATKPVLQKDNGKVDVVLNSANGNTSFNGRHKGYYMVETAANTYQFYRPTVKAVTEAYNEYKDGDTTATAYTAGEDVACFAFNAKLPDAVLAAAKANPAAVTVEMTWKAGDNKSVTTTFQEESVANWLNDNGASKAFYVNLKGLSEAPDKTTITCTPKITIDQVTYYFADIVLKTAAAA